MSPTAANLMHRADNTETHQHTPTADHVLLKGLVRLVEGLRTFAEELGLPQDCMFGETCRIFRDAAPAAILGRWLENPQDGPLKLQNLFDDLTEHHLALGAALEGVADETLSRLSPRAVSSASLRIFGWRPFAWRTFRRLHRTYTQAPYQRHQELVVQGFAKAYRSHRERLRNAAAIVEPLPPAAKE